MDYHIFWEEQKSQQRPLDFLWLLPKLLLFVVSNQEEVASHFIVFILRNILICHPYQSSIALACGITEIAVLNNLHIWTTWKDFKEILMYGPHSSPNDSEFPEVVPGHLCWFICVKLRDEFDSQWELEVTAFSNIYLGPWTWSARWCEIHRVMKLTSQLYYSQDWWQVVHCSLYMWRI